MLKKNKDKVALSSLSPKDKFMIGKDKFIVLEQNKGSTKIISENFIYFKENFGDSSNWKKSTIRQKLSKEYLNKITKFIKKKNIKFIKRNLASIDGFNYGSCKDRISILTYEEYKKYSEIFNNKLESSIYWWLATPNDLHMVYCVAPNGDLSCLYDFISAGVRALLILKSSTLVFKVE